MRGFRTGGHDLASGEQREFLSPPPRMVEEFLQTAGRLDDGTMMADTRRADPSVAPSSVGTFDSGLEVRLVRPMFRTERLFGLDFVAEATISDVSDALVRAGNDSDPGWRCVVTPNVDHLVRYRQFAADAAVARNAMLVLPDGMPIVWASRILGAPLRSRLAGSDLFPLMWRALTLNVTPAVVISPSVEVSALLQAEHSGCCCVEPPFFDVDDDATIDTIIAEVDGAVEHTSAAFVFVALSVAKTHALAARLEDHWHERPTPTPIVLLVGASPEFYLGLVKRAPRWMRRSGLEWLHRLLKDPRRMVKRYLFDDLVFFRLVWEERRNR